MRIAAVAEFERDLLMQRTLSGQARAPSQRKFGRPAALSVRSAAISRGWLAEGQWQAGSTRAAAHGHQPRPQQRRQGHWARRPVGARFMAPEA